MINRNQIKVVEEVLFDKQLNILNGVDSLKRLAAELIQFIFFFAVGTGILIRKFIFALPDSGQRYWDLLLAILCLVWSFFLLLRAITSKKKRGGGMAVRSNGLSLIPENQTLLPWENIKKISFLPWIVTIKGNDGTKFSVNYLNSDFEQLMKVFSLLVTKDEGSSTKAQKCSKELRDHLKSLIWKQEYGGLSESEKANKLLNENAVK